MRKITKLFAGLLASAMVLTMSTAVFASAEEKTSTSTYTDHETVTIQKKYKLTNEGTISPAETFTLEQVGAGRVTDGEATSAPALGTITGAAYAVSGATTAGAIEDITVNLPVYESVGIYEYTLKEVAGTTAGVTYYGNNIKLVVTVIQGDNGKLRVAAVHTEDEGGTKSDTFENIYSAGQLNVSKTVTGNLGDENKYFEFKVTLTGETGKTYGTSYAVTGGSATSNPTSIEIGEETTFQLKHGETLHIANLPYGVTYAVTETAADGYTTVKTGDKGTINVASTTAAFTNNKTGEIDMGVNLDNVPYILVLAVVVIAAGTVFAFKKRKGQN